MSTEKLKKILAEFDSSGATELEYEDTNFRVIVKKNNPEISSNEGNCLDHQILSPLVGTYYDASPAIRIDEKIKEGQLLCTIESMKTMNKICAPTDLIIKKIYFKNGDIIGYNSPLFEVDYI